jgi:hypothetical protein
VLRFLGFWCCPIKSGKEQEVKVHHNEGVATRIGPEPCAGTREGGHASVSKGTGFLLRVRPGDFIKDYRAS